MHNRVFWVLADCAMHCNQSRENTVWLTRSLMHVLSVIGNYVRAFCSNGELLWSAHDHRSYNVHCAIEALTRNPETTLLVHSTCPCATLHQGQPHWWIDWIYLCMSAARSSLPCHRLTHAIVLTDNTTYYLGASLGATNIPTGGAANAWENPILQFTHPSRPSATFLN